MADPDLPFNAVSRRKFLVTLGAGVGLSIALGSVARVSSRPAPVRPPGAIREEAFLALCARCGRCVSVCPGSALRLQGPGNGLENIMTPVLVPTQGYCILPVTGCQSCIQACPSGVLRPIDLSGVSSHDLSKRVKMGTAYVNTKTCIPYSLNKPCLACKEACPVEGAITTKGGGARSAKKPVFNHDICVGCGACENVCPTSPKSVTVSPSGALRE